MPPSPPPGPSTPPNASILEEIVAAAKEAGRNVRDAAIDARDWYRNNHNEVNAAAVAGATAVGAITAISYATGFLEIPMYLTAAWITGLGINNVTNSVKAINDPAFTVNLNEPHERDGYKAAAAALWSVAAWKAGNEYVDANGVLETAGAVVELLGTGVGGHLLYQGLQHTNHEAAQAREIMDNHAGRSAGYAKHLMIQAGIPEQVANKELAKRVARNQRMRDGGFINSAITLADLVTRGGIVRPTTRKYLTDTVDTLRDMKKNTVQAVRDIGNGASQYWHHHPRSLAGRTAMYTGILGGLEFIASHYGVDDSTLYNLFAAGAITATGALNARQFRVVGATEEARRESRVEKCKRTMIPRGRRLHQRTWFPAAATAAAVLALGSVLYSATASLFEGVQRYTPSRADQEGLDATSILTGQLPWPVVPQEKADDGSDVPLKESEKQIGSRYGFRRGGLFISTYHPGADIGPSSGNYDVIAVGDGIVTKTNKCLGQVNILHGSVLGEPVTTRYLHGEDIAVKVGDHVKKGQRLMEMSTHFPPLGIHDDGTCSPAKYAASFGEVPQHVHFELILGDDAYVRVPSTGTFARGGRVLSKIGNELDEGHLDPECFLGTPGRDYHFSGRADVAQPKDLDRICRPVWDAVGYQRMKKGKR